MNTETKVQQNEAIFRRVIDEVFNQGHYEVLPELFPSEFAEHQFDMAPNRAGLQSKVEWLRSTFPDIHMTVEDITTDGDKVWAMMKCRGTNTVGMMGPPNGKRYEITVFDLVRIEDGKIVEHWGVPDLFAQMAQLGLLPQRQG